AKEDREEHDGRVEREQHRHGLLPAGRNRYRRSALLGREPGPEPARQAAFRGLLEERLPPLEPLPPGTGVQPALEVGLLVEAVGHRPVRLVRRLGREHTRLLETRERRRGRVDALLPPRVLLLLPVARPGVEQDRHPARGRLGSRYRLPLLLVEEKRRQL